ncbi:MAG: ferredoxin-type protein NapF [Pseudomonadota bacterium]|nr:ferredoxin-type protein NapF [Pseudomonadota bacterium]
MDTSRRRFLQGGFGEADARDAIRLPWSTDHTAFINGCTRCGDCIACCPQRIIRPGAGGYPELDFSERECTFCGNCAHTCQQPLFDLEHPPWQHRAQIGTDCLTHAGIVCQNCKDACTASAIRFQFARGGIAKPVLDVDRCTGCGACIAPCPNDSIRMTTQPESSTPL